MTDRPRGRRAEQPKQIPGLGWLDILWRVRQSLASDRVTLLAAGIVFYSLLSLIPAIAAILLGSGGLSLYVRHVTHLGELFGSLGAVVVLMMWFWLSAFVVLLGAGDAADPNNPEETR